MRARRAVARRRPSGALAAQWPIEEKAARADYVIRTDGTYAETDAQVAALLERLGQDAARRNPSPA